MSQDKGAYQGVGVCSAEVGSSALARRAQKALEMQNIRASVGKTATDRGCVYTVNFSCLMQKSAEAILSSNGIRIKRYL